MIFGAQGPSIFVGENAAGATRNDGFHGDDQAFGEHLLGVRVRVIGDVGRFVNSASNAVTTQFSDDGKTGLADFAFDGFPDFDHTNAGVGDLHGLVEGAFGAGHQICGLQADAANGDGDGGVCHVSVFLDGDIELHEIAFSEFALAGNSVDRFVVEADATRAGKLVNHRRSRTGSIVLHDAGADVIEMLGGDAGSDFSLHRVEDHANDASCGLEGEKVLLVLNAHMGSVAKDLSRVSHHPASV